MDRPEFEDVKMALVNGQKFAKNYDEFIQKALTAIQNGLNETTVPDELLGMSLRKGLSPEEYQREKVNLMVVCFWICLDSCQPLRHEFAQHLYNELRKDV